MKPIPFGQPILGKEERDAVMAVLGGTTLVHGPRAKDFEKSFGEFTGAPHAISVSSCTAGLHLSYLHLGLGVGDEVIVPAQTHTATVHAVEFCGAKPVFVDAEAKTGNIDLEQVERQITPRTRALSVVHFLGMPVDMGRVRAISEKHQIFVVEDCALSLGAKYRGTHTGLFGNVGVFSFYPAKHMTTCEGGMVITRSPEIAKKMARQKAFGVDLDVSERKSPGIYDVTMLGYNYRMSEMQAALGVEQLRRVPSFLETRRRNYDALRAGLRHVEEVTLLESTHGDYESSYYCLSVLLNDKLAQRRTEIVSSLKEAGIGTSVYYPRPVPHLSYYREKYGYSGDTYPVAARISRASIAFPVGPHLNEEDMARITGTLKTAIESVKKT